MEKQDPLKFKIINEIGVISEGKDNWKKEFNRVSWNGREPKYDIRDWDTNHEKMNRGVTLTEADLRKLKELIDKEIVFE